MALTISVAEIVESSKNPLLGKHESWGRVLLGEIAIIQNGFPFKSTQFTRNEGMPLIRIRDVGADNTDTNYVGDYDPAFVVKAGDLLIGMDGDFNCARWRGPDGLLNQRVCRVILKSDIYHPKLLDYALPGYLKAINDMTSSVTVKHLSSKSIAEIPLPLPPMVQQKHIVAEIEKQFSRLDEAVANLKRVKANLKRYKAAVLKAAVEGRLVETEAELARREGRSFETGEQLLQRILETRRSQWQGKGKYKEPAAPDTTDLPALPEGWVWANFDQVAERVTKGSSPNWQGFEYCQEGIPFVRSQNVGWGVTDLSDIAYLPHGFNNVEKKSVLREGDVLLNIVGASIGRTAIAPSAVEGGNVNQAVAVIRLFASVVRNEFVLFYLLSAQTQRRIHAEKVDVARANFSLEDIREMPLALPPRGEQDRIVAEVDRRLSILDETQTQVDVNLRRAERMRAAILVNAFTRRHSRGTVGVVAINVES